MEDEPKHSTFRATGARKLQNPAGNGNGPNSSLSSNNDPQNVAETPKPTASRARSRRTKCRKQTSQKVPRSTLKVAKCWKNSKIPNPSQLLCFAAFLSLSLLLAADVARQAEAAPAASQRRSQMRRRSSSQLPESIYKTAPLLFGADIIQDYFSESAQARASTRSGQTGQLGAQQQLNQLDYDALQAESVQSPTVRSSGVAVARSSANLKPHSKSATTTKSPRMIGKQVLQRQLSKLAKEKRPQKHQAKSHQQQPNSGVQQLTTGRRKLQAASFQTKPRFANAALFDAIDASDSEEAPTKTNHLSAIGGGDSQPADAPVDLEQPAKTGSAVLGDASSEPPETTSGHHAAESTTVDELVTDGRTINMDQTESTTMNEDNAGRVDLNQASGQVAGEPDGGGQAAQPTNKSLQQQGGGVSMDQVISSLGLVVEAMRQQTMAMQVISGRMTNSKDAQQQQLAQTSGDTKQESAGPNLEVRVNEHQSHQPQSVLVAPAAPQSTSTFTTTFTNSNSNVGQQPTTTTTQVLSSASQEEARALLESFGELMSGLTGNRAAKQLVLDSLGGGGGGSNPLPLAVVQPSGVKTADAVATVDQNNGQVVTASGGVKQAAGGELTSAPAGSTSASTAPTTPSTTTTTTPTPTTTTHKPSTTTISTTTTTAATTTATEHQTTTSAGEEVETIPPYVMHMINKQKKTTPQPVHPNSMKSVSMNYASSSSLAMPRHRTSNSMSGWRMVKPFDFYPNHAIPQEQGDDDKRSVSFSYDAAMKSPQMAEALSSYATDGRNQDHGESMRNIMMFAKSPITAYSDHPLTITMQQQQELQSQVYGAGNANQATGNQMPLVAASPYKQQQQQQPKMVANMMAAAVAAATAAEQHQAMQQTMSSMQQQQQDQSNHSDEIPKLPGSAANNGGTSGRQQQQNTAMVAAQMMSAALSGGGAKRLPSGALQIGEQPPFNLANFQLLSPVEAGKQQQQQQQMSPQAMAALVQSAVKELASVQQQKQSNSLAAKQKSSSSDQQPAGSQSNDLSENASEAVKQSTKNSGQDQSSGSDEDQNENEKQQQQQVKKRPQLVAARPPQQPVTSTKLTSFSILGGRFKLTPHTQMLQAILAPSKQLIKHALSDLISPNPQAGPLINQQAVVPRRGQRSRSRAPSSGGKQTRSAKSSVKPLAKQSAARAQKSSASSMAVASSGSSQAQT